MPKQGQTTKQARRAERQEDHRKWLSEKCTLQHLFDNLIKIEGLDASAETFSNDLNKYKEANAQRIKLMGFYLPLLKSTELTGPDGGPMQIADVSFTFNPVDEDD